MTMQDSDASKMLIRIAELITEHGNATQDRSPHCCNMLQAVVAMNCAIRNKRLEPSGFIRTRCATTARAEVVIIACLRTR
jgi:hypothetical protein